MMRHRGIDLYRHMLVIAAIHCRGGARPATRFECSEVDRLANYGEVFQSFRFVMKEFDDFASFTEPILRWVEAETIAL